MLRPVEKAEKIKKDANSLYQTVQKAYKVVEGFKIGDEKKSYELENLIRQNSSNHFTGALSTGANNLQKILQGTYSGKMPTGEALKNLQTINISVMTAQMVASEILADGKQTSLDEERF